MILAIDPSSSSCGYALFDTNGHLKDAGSVKAHKSSGAEKRFEIVSMLEYILKGLDFEALACEEPKLGGRWQTASQTGMDKLLGQIEYMFLSTISVNNPEIYYVHPMTLKAQIGGSGKASKLDVALGAGELLDTEEEKEILARLIEEEDFDATDAIAVGLTYIRNLND